MPTMLAASKAFIWAPASPVHTSEAAAPTASHRVMAHRLPVTGAQPNARRQGSIRRARSRRETSAAARFPIFERRAGFERLREIEALPRRAAERGERGRELDR